MAGAGWRQFTVGQLLTSAQVQTFLQDQAVQVFASAAARTSALGTAVSAGMVSYRSDDKALELYAGSAWQPVIQGRNAVINGGMDIWQRGTSFVANSTGTLYGADRWQPFRVVTGSTFSQQTATDATNLPNIQFSGRFQRDSGNTATNALILDSSLESAMSFPLVGQTVTLSFYARRGANYSATGNTLAIRLISGTGTNQNALVGFTGETFPIDNTVTLGTTWQRYSFTGSVPTSSRQLAIRMFANPTGTAGANDWFEVTGVQLEAGSVATPFVRAGGTLQGELAACQRYYQRYTSVANNAIFTGTMFTSTIFYGAFVFPKMRVAPSSSVSAAASFTIFGAGTSAVSTAAGLNTLSDVSAEVQISIGAPITANSGAWARWAGTTGFYFFELSAEL
jgi:hypothetical protein